MLDGQKTKTVKVVFKELGTTLRLKSWKSFGGMMRYWIFQYFLMLISMMSDDNDSRFSKIDARTDLVILCVFISLKILQLDSNNDYTNYT